MKQPTCPACAKPIFEPATQPALSAEEFKKTWHCSVHKIDCNLYFRSCAIEFAEAYREASRPQPPAECEFCYDSLPSHRSNCRLYEISRHAQAWNARAERALQLCYKELVECAHRNTHSTWGIAIDSVAQVLREYHQEAQASKCESSRPQPDERQDSFWVVERFANGKSAGYWNGGNSREFVTKIKDAIQFCRRQDAMWGIVGWHWGDVELTEHRYMTLPAPSAPQEQKLAPINPASGEWSDWPIESFEERVCACSDVENHMECGIHGEPLSEYKRTHPKLFRLEIPAPVLSPEECHWCKHSLKNNSHGFDQSDAWMDGDKLVHSGQCTYCKICRGESAAPKEGK
jgi:hypothetical protein